MTRAARRRDRQQVQRKWEWVKRHRERVETCLVISRDDTRGESRFALIDKSNTAHAIVDERHTIPSLTATLHLMDNGQCPVPASRLHIVDCPLGIGSTEAEQDCRRTPQKNARPTDGRLN